MRTREIADVGIGSNLHSLNSFVLACLFRFFGACVKNAYRVSFLHEVTNREVAHLHELLVK